MERGEKEIVSATEFPFLPSNARLQKALVGGAQLKGKLHALTEDDKVGEESSSVLGDRVLAERAGSFDAQFMATPDIPSRFRRLRRNLVVTVIGGD